MLSYLNKKKGQDASMDAGVPVQRAIESNGFSEKGEEKKETGPTLY